MNGHGIGIDVIEVERVEASLAKHGERFLQRVFTEAERDYCLKQHSPCLLYTSPSPRDRG